MISPPLLRPETTSDFPAIRKLVTDAFGQRVEADLVERIRDSADYRPDLSLVAESDGEILGHVMISSALLRHSTADRTIASLSPLSVAPQAQGLGIGGALVRAVLALADTAGEPFVILQGSPRYYSRFGFEPAAGFGIYMALPEWAPPEAGQLCRLSGFDAQDPKMKGTVILPSAFDGVD